MRATRLSVVVHIVATTMTNVPNIQVSQLTYVHLAMCWLMCRHYSYMKVLSGFSCKTIYQSLRKSHPVLAQALPAYINIAEGRATEVPSLTCTCTCMLSTIH